MNLTVRTYLSRTLSGVLRSKEGLVGRSKPKGMAAFDELQKEKRMEEMMSTTAVDRIDYERPLKVVSYPDPRLRLPNFKIKLPADGIEDLARDMFEIMYSDDGIGLAAPQVGVNVQMMVFNPEGPEARGDKSKEVVLINPRILKEGKEREVDEEGCLSFYDPVHIYGMVERARVVKIKALGLGGEKLTMTLEGLPARIFQHEFDHLQGVLFFERMSPEELDKVSANLRRYEEEFVQKNPGVPIKRFFP